MMSKLTAILAVLPIMQYTVAIKLSQDDNDSDGESDIPIIHPSQDSLQQLYDINFEGELEKPTDIYTNFEEYVNSYGFVWEEHEVVTEDKYILREFRIPGILEELFDEQQEYLDTEYVREDVRKPVIVLMHGLMSSMETWFQIQNLSIPFQLALRGYDVWILNGRGNQYGRAHEYLNADYDRAFWNFSFDNKGLYDVNNAIDYILGVTGEKSVSFMSHSQGTSDLFFAASASEELQLNLAQKINIFVAFGPVVLLDHCDETLKNISEQWVPITQTAFLLDLYEIPPCSYQNQDVCLDLNDEDTVNEFDVTQEQIDELNDYVSEWVDSSFIYNNETDYIGYANVYLESGTSGSLFELLHYSQIIETSEFKAFDYAYLAEVPTIPDSVQSFQTEYYGQDEAPMANITNIEIPTALILAKNDTLSTIQDAQYILQNMQDRYIVYYDEIEGGHETFLAGKDRSFMEDIYALIYKYSFAQEIIAENVEKRVENRV